MTGNFVREAVKLSTICGGAAEELFQLELKKILANVRDANTDPEAKRKITLEIAFEPYKDRTGTTITIGTKTTLAAADHASGTLHIGTQDGAPVAYAFDPRQEQLFETPVEGPKN